MKGIILAGGQGTRLYPLTSAISKQILPVYDKPMIYYSMSVLMLAGIRDILIISTPRDIPLFESILSNGEKLGLKIEYKIQENPDGLPQAFILGEEFIGNDDVALILGDNIFFGQGLSEILKNAVKNNTGATLFGYQVRDPERFGVVEFDDSLKVKSLEEKPEYPKSNFAVTGLYIYSNDVIEKAKLLEPSSRGELEITDLNNLYLDEGRLNVELLGRGFAWLDTGTFESLLSASSFVETIEMRQGFKIACIEEIAYRQGYISREQLIQLGEELKKSLYGQYLLEIAGD
ncbi:glucose-1-phosphate thymidylyltransferase RfbA [Lysinibacillus sp. Ag94]|uniref:glucose-1-phosphate thymidylyltransferase RfbA n=1 Tax=Lysinibacillus sp. Ag94 TaxID=2936682 RepID=UPI002010142B|nr:glucose-1-phosphate thymidylyltransferase RfbA [Lysinibacillus sp. Ag94]UPW83764.1 glucose-1-phosphate thymidylyltransferase RfbA [Lysinibacillus sp. Ag94]